MWRLTSAADFSVQVCRCPLRYVLDDELVRTCVEFAYSEGDELSGCLDLLHFPAEHLWIEWRDAAQREALASVLPECVRDPARTAERSGALISTSRRGRAGSVRSFWRTGYEPHEAQVSAVETLLDLDFAHATAGPHGLLEDGGAAVFDPKNACLSELLRCARFRVDSAWRRYYRAVLTDPAAARAIPLLVSGVAFDVPMLLGLFLLMAVRADLLQRAVNPQRLNHKRARLGKRPLLEHIEVSAPLFAQADCHSSDSVGGFRSSPRLHHVRGHIVRRRNTVYWRGPHWRGHLRLGQVRSRTVELRLHG